MRRVRVTILVAGFVGVIAVARAAWSESEGHVPPKGFVPDAVTASRIAEAVWIPIYGEEKCADAWLALLGRGTVTRGHPGEMVPT
jgi:hypothetical protein